MNNLDKIKFALEYIEDNFSNHINLNMIANRVGLSKYYFHRVFKDIFHIPVMEYIRNRRLSYAAEKLQSTDLRVMDIALEAGYSSQAAFTRSFKKLFGINPKEVIEGRPITNYFNPIDFDSFLLRHNNSHSIDYEIINLKQIKLVGLEQETTGKNKQYYADNSYLWHSIMSQESKLHHLLVNLSQGYGISQWEYTLDRISYFCGFEVSGFENIPSRMTTRILPEQKYVRFIHRGKILNEMHKTIDYIFLCWFPGSDYEPLFQGDKNMIIECHTDKTTSLEDSEVQLLVPIKRKLS